MAYCVDRNAAFGRWISVEDGMPEYEGMDVLAWMQEGFACVDIFVNNGFALARANHTKVTHWMPLPKSPEVVDSSDMETSDTIKVMLDEGAFEPVRAHQEDAGLDLLSPTYGMIASGGCLVVDTGVHVQIPKGFVGMLKSKSGLNFKCGIVGEGVIDAGYTGSIKVKLYNLGDRLVQIERGDKITQLVILPMITPEIERVDSLEQTDRGDGGFGSTGR